MIMERDKELKNNNLYILTARKLPRLNDRKLPHIIILGCFRSI